MLILILRNGGVATALILLAALLLQRKHRVRVYHIVGVCLLALYLSAVFALTGITPMSGGFRLDIHLEEINYVPVVGMAEIIQTSVKNRDPAYAVYNLLGNVAMFAPLGALLPLLWKRYRKLWKTALFALVLSLGIELFQMFLLRGVDIDDVILNVLGAVAGYGAFKLLKKFAKRFVNRCMLGKLQRETLWRLFPYACVLVPLAVSLAFGTIDRGRFFAPPAESAAVAETETPDAQPGDAEPTLPEATPEPAQPAELQGEKVGTLALNDEKPMTLMSQLTIPPVTAELSDADRAVIVKLFTGHTLLDVQPACDGDLVIQTEGVTLVVHTECGSVMASLPELSGATTLTADELATLNELLARYEMTAAGARQPEETAAADDVPAA